MNPSPRILVVLLALALTAALAAEAAAVKHVVRVYYFHTTQRCTSCKKIEALSAETIRERFTKEMRDGTVEWQPVNIDDPSHKHFVKDYQLYTKSVVVVDLVDGRETRWKNLAKIWELLGDETAFRRYVQDEVRAYLEPGS